MRNRLSRIAILASVVIAAGLVCAGIIFRAAAQPTNNPPISFPAFILGLPAPQTLSGAELIPMIQNGASTAISEANFMGYLYSFGTWAPGLAGSVTPGVITYVVQSGSWEKIGRQVTARFNLSITSGVGINGNLMLTGLPFTSVNSANEMGGCTILGTSQASPPADVFPFYFPINNVLMPALLFIYPNSSQAAFFLRPGQQIGGGSPPANYNLNSVNAFGVCHYRV
jgi:hypothetical protein